ncbi:MAG: hypothetical protein KDC88_08185 [Ignavibacteriae bacterium]|nr:hypothetical protein [Ignavibacteriota bacterium]MCB9209460.1 hypothetical protein [Ignavibacteriales bacterium]MCB9258103.1 hypothetical protein [Ignavibacteriales bacterium]
MENLEVTYKLIKKLECVKEELVDWARLSREKKMNEKQIKNMMTRAHGIDELLREIGIEWVEDYEANKKIKASLKL